MDQKEDEVIQEQVSSFGLEHTLLKPSHWSPDGKYLYNTIHPVSKCCNFFESGGVLKGANLVDKTIVDILPDVVPRITISPDDRLLAPTTLGSPPDLVIMELTTGDERRIPLDAEDAGSIVWSPDGDYLVVILANRTCMPGWEQGLEVVVAGTGESGRLQLLMIVCSRLLIWLMRIACYYRIRKVGIGG
jgi:Tol biopolymer transport system component